MQNSYRADLVQSWYEEEQQPFKGWDFSHLDGRMIEEQPPWSYSAMAKELLNGTTAVLDMGTAGGERFSMMRDYWPKKVAVTEEYPPNLALARERLTPLGVDVFDVRLTHTDPMPFANGEFDLILNRHSAFNSNEVARILTNGGIFFSQQVHGLWADDLIEAFGAKPQWPDSTPENYSKRLAAAGLTIELAENWRGKLTFTDVGAIVYYLNAVPWTVQGFSVKKHLSHLHALQARLDAGEKLSFSARKFLIKAQKSN